MHKEDAQKGMHEGENSSAGHLGCRRAGLDRVGHERERLGGGGRQDCAAPSVQRQRGWLGEADGRNGREKRPGQGTDRC